VAVVLGLGNPGARYERTRHNVGWRVVERLAESWKAEPFAADPAWYRAWRALRSGKVADLVMPLGFMNRSGEALEAWRDRHGLEPGELLVVADDVYLPVGMVRLRGRGSSGGHRGLEDVERALGTSEYARLRIGVGVAAGGGEGLREHVLEEFGDDELPAAGEGLSLAAQAVECWFDEGLIAAMDRFNRRVRQEESES
jgi:PTH1 family peptidyl-tRNA hydrolase